MTCSYVKSKFDTPNYIKFSRTPFTNSTSTTCWSEGFYLLHIYICIYIYTHTHTHISICCILVYTSHTRLRSQLHNIT